MNKDDLATLKYDIKNEILTIISKDIFAIKQQLQNLSYDNQTRISGIEKLINDNISVINNDIDYIKQNFDAKTCLTCCFRKK